MRYKKGFTLVELLVVIAIIAVLMAILLPSLNKAKDQAKGVTCLNNLRQIGLAAMLYADDYDNFVPRSAGRRSLGSGKIYEGWILYFLPYIGGKSNETKDYREIDVYDCPNYPVKEQTVDYVINSWKDGNKEYIGFSKLSDFRQPGTKIFLADHEYGDEKGSWRPIIRDQSGLNQRGQFDVWRPWHLPSWPNLSDRTRRRVAKARHRDGCNVMLLDGHSTWVQAEKNIPKLWQPK